VEKLAEGVAQLEDELKVKVADYNSAKSALSAISRKAGGSLATRDLGDVVAAAPRGALTESEHLTTLLVAVPAHAAKEWRGCYESLTQYVVPRSSRLLKEESDYALFTVTLFKRVADAFKTAARERYAHKSAKNGRCAFRH
jgi:V-type H+-transporting ATPase subunit C